MDKRTKISAISCMLAIIVSFIFMANYSKCPTAQNLCQQSCEEKYKEFKKPGYNIIGIDKGSTKTHLRCNCYLGKDEK